MTTIQNTQIIGKIKEQNECCRFLLNIHDKNDTLIYRVDAPATQCGVGWRGSVFGKCYEVFFPVFKPDNPSRSIDAKDGHIHKKHSACYVEENVDNAEAVEVLFPNDATAEQKLLLILTALNIDFRFYEENPFEVNKEAELEG